MPNPRGEISLADGRQVHGLDLGVQDIWEGHEAYKDLEEPIRADGCVRRVGYRWGGVPAYKTKQWGINHSLSTV